MLTLTYGLSQTLCMRVCAVIRQVFVWRMCSPNHARTAHKHIKDEYPSGRNAYDYYTNVFV